MWNGKVPWMGSFIDAKKESLFLRVYKAFHLFQRPQLKSITVVPSPARGWSAQECNEELLVFSSYEYLLTESKASNKLKALWLVPAHSEDQFQPVRGLRCLCCCPLFCLSSKFLYREEGKDLNRKMLTAKNSAVPKAQKDRQTQHHISECACNTKSPLFFSLTHPPCLL